LARQDGGKDMKKIVLASQSPRRKELLARIVPEFTVIVTQADENISDSLPPEEYVMQLACRKARAAECSSSLVIGSDTVVVCNGQILGKPRDEQDAYEMLKVMSGRSHFVYTGVAVIDGEREIVDFEKTEVVFDSLSDETIRKYIATGEPMDKAGSYGIQGIGSVLVSEIHGDYSNVVGLPLFKLSKMLRECGVSII